MEHLYFKVKFSIILGKNFATPIFRCKMVLADKIFLEIVIQHLYFKVKLSIILGKNYGTHIFGCKMVHNLGKTYVTPQACK